MPEALVVQPDSKFIQSVIAAGGDGLKKCFQCATCTSVCSLAGEGGLFPRKQVLEAQWGLKEQLMADPGVWLCHNCGDCSKRCPRDARPAQTLGAIRGEVIKRYSYPHFMGSLVSSPLALPLLLLVPMVILYAIATWPLAGRPVQGWEYALMFPQNRLEPLFFAVGFLVVLAYSIGLVNFVRGLRTAGVEGRILPSLGPVLLEIMTHRRFSKCSTETYRYWGHLLVLAGFVGLGIVGTLIGIGTMIGVMHTPLPILGPFKLFANACALVALAGSTILIVGRVKDQDSLSSTYFDWFFLSILTIVLVTGALSEALRLAQNEAWMYPVYFVHLTLILALFLYAPYSKFAHLGYRTVAMAATWEKRQPSSAAKQCEPNEIPAGTAA